MRVQIIFPDNGAGLSRDAKIIYGILEQAGHKVFPVNTLNKGLSLMDADVNIHLEIPEPKYIPDAKKNLFIPNPEWFKPNYEHGLRGMDIVIAKTRDCEAIFKTRHQKVIYTSFTSEDRCDMNVHRKRAFLHSPGKSSAKGTSQVIDCWKTHFNDLPDLNIIQWQNNKDPKRPNINYLFGKVEDEKYKQVQNHCVFHLCPSSYEGFGHYYWEALSCGAVVITTDSPPMNETLTENTGLLVRPTTVTFQYLATMQHVSATDLYFAAKKCVEMDTKEINTRSMLARNVWVTNDRFFRKEFLKAIET